MFKELYYKAIEQLYKPRKPIMRITKYNDTNYWMQLSNSETGHFMTDTEVAEFKAKGWID